MMRQASLALIISLLGGTLLCIALILAGAPQLPMLLASEAAFVALFALSWWKPHIWRSRLRQKPAHLKMTKSKIIVLGRKRGYQPTDTPPPQSPPHSISAVFPYGQASEDELSEPEYDWEEVSLPKETESDEKDMPPLIGYAADPAGRKSQHGIFDQFVLMQGWRTSESNRYEPPEYEDMQFGTADWQRK